MCIATRWSIGQQQHYTISRNSTYIYVSFIAAYLFAVFSNTTWRRVIIPYGAIPYRYRTAAVLPVLYRTVRYRYRPYGTVPVPVRRYSILNLYSDPTPLVNMCLVKKHLLSWGVPGGGTDFLTPCDTPLVRKRTNWRWHPKATVHYCTVRYLTIPYRTRLRDFQISILWS
jgi:hypothetical protein